MGCKQDMETVVGKFPRELGKPDPLQQHITAGIGEDLLIDPVPPIFTGIGQPVQRYPGNRI